MFEIFEEEQIHKIRIIKFNTLNNSMWGNHSSWKPAVALRRTKKNTKK